MRVYCLTGLRYKNQLSGKGAEIFGGRWNSKGVSMVYTSESRALCTAEVAVHVPFGVLPKQYYLQTIELPDQFILTLNEDALGQDWRSFPHLPSTKRVGDDFVKKSKYMSLKVPSAIVQDEYNYLINDQHQDFPLVKLMMVEEFRFDHRLFRK